jgi:integrase
MTRSRGGSTRSGSPGVAKGRAGRLRAPQGTIDVLPSGSIRVRVDGGFDPVTRKRIRPTETIPAGPNAKREADNALTRLLNQVIEDRHAKTNASVAHLLDRYQAERQIGDKIARTTLARDQEIIDLHIVPIIGKEKAGKKPKNLLKKLYAECYRCRIHCREANLVDHRTRVKHVCDARCKPHACLGLATSTVRKIHFILTGAYSAAIEWDWWSIDPLAGLKAPEPVLPEPDPPSPKEAAIIVADAYRRDLAWGMYVWLTMILGARRGEVIAIRRRHWDSERKVIYLRRAVAQVRDDVFEKDIKNHIRRNVVLDDETNEMLAEYWAHVEAIAQAAGIELDDDAFMFSLTPDHSAALKPRSVTQRYRRMVRSLGIDTQMKSLRHYNATELIAAGIDIRTVAGRLGHAGGGTTTLRVYAAWKSEADQRAAGELRASMPARPTIEDPVERAKTRPSAPYEHTAATMRRAIIDGDLEPGSVAPSIKEMAAAHRVSIGTAHRAAGLLRAWGLLSEGGRGKRPLILEHRKRAIEDAGPAARALSGPADADVPAAGTTLLDLQLIYLAEPVKSFLAEADPADPAQLRRLLLGAARRHGGRGITIDDYELIIRGHDTGEVIATFAAL